MSATRELEEQITRAHERGDQVTLRRLQDRYRKTADVVRITRGPISLAERSAPVVVPEASPAPKPTGTLPSVVRLSAEAYSTIVNDWPHELGAECGGYMTGYDDGQEIVVETIFAARGGDPVGERDRVVLDRDWFDVVEAKAQSYGHRVVGDVHTHTHSEPKLSGIDERGLRGAADAMGRNWIGLVIGRDPDRLSWGAHDELWLRPEVRGYLAPAADNSVRPIAVVIEGRG